MTFLLLAALAAQADPQIESVEYLVGKVRRPYFWTPLAVTVRSAAGFEGDLVARSSMGVRVARAVHLKPGGSERVLLPAINPQDVVAGPSVFAVTKDLRTPDYVVLVESGLAYAGDLTSDDRVSYQKVERADLEWLLAQGLLDACDLVLLKDVSGLSVATARAWAVAPTKSDAEREVADRLQPSDPPKLVDLELWSLEPGIGWVPAKKERTILFSALYALAGFAGLVFLGRRHSGRAPALIAGLALAGVAFYFVAFPRKHLSVWERPCEVVPPDGDARIFRLWFVGAATELTPVLDFPRIVKPVFAKMGDAEEPMTIRVRERGGSTVEGFALSSGRTRAFVGVEGRAPTMRVTDRLPKPLYAAWVRSGGVDRFVGDLAAGAPVPREATGGAASQDSEGKAWLRLLEGEGVSGMLDRGARVADDVGSPDLADGRKGPVFFIQRLR